MSKRKWQVVKVTPTKPMPIQEAVAQFDTSEQARTDRCRRELETAKDKGVYYLVRVLNI